MGCTTSHADELPTTVEDITQNSELAAGGEFTFSGYEPTAVEPVAAAAPVVEQQAIEQLENAEAAGTAVVKDTKSTGWPGYGSPEEAMMAHHAQADLTAVQQAAPSGQLHAVAVAPSGQLPVHAEYATKRDSIFNMAAVDAADTAAVEEMQRRVEAYNNRQEELAYGRAFTDISSQGGQNIQIVENANGYLHVEPMPMAQPVQPMAQPLPAQAYGAEPQPLPAQAYGAEPQPLPAQPYGAEPQPLMAQQIVHAEDPERPAEAVQALPLAQPVEEPAQAVAEPALAQEVQALPAEEAGDAQASEPTKKKKRWGLF